MPAFQYAALDQKGRTRKGLLEGDTARQVRQLLRERDLTPLQVEEVSRRHHSKNPVLLQWRRRLNASELALITRQLATLVGAGLPIEQALGAIAQQNPKPRLQNLLAAVRDRVMEGYTLAHAVGDFPQAFPELYQATIAAGEQSGHLEIVLERLADYTEKRHHIRQQVTLALFYPALLTFVALVIVIGLLTYVVPQVTQVFVSMRQELPWLTRYLIAVSDFFKQYGWLVAIAGLALAGGFGYAIRNVNSRRLIQQLLLRIPLIGRLVRGVNSARFARTFSILIASGVPALEALRIAAQVMANLPMRAAVNRAAIKVKEGSSLHQALAGSGYFSPLTLQLVASGELSGRLEHLMDRAASQQEKETETLIAALLGIFEPVLILCMGAMILTIVLAILLPIFDLNQMIR